MSVQTNVTLNSDVRNVRVVLDINNTIIVESRSSDESFETVLAAAVAQLGREVDVESLLAVGPNGSTRVTDRSQPIGETTAVVVDRQRTNG